MDDATRTVANVSDGNTSDSTIQVAQVIPSIKFLLDAGSYIIVLDTNVLLNIYKYSPDFSEFVMNCLQKVQSYVVLTSTVKLEFDRHHKAEFGGMKNRVEKAGEETLKRIKGEKQKIIHACDTMEKLHFPSIADLKHSLSIKLDEAQKEIDSYLEEHNNLDIVSNSWNSDKLADYISSVTVMPDVSQAQIYYWCDEGEKRYKKETPPGFMDSKTKTGVRQYSDLILWKEILSYSRRNNKDVVFVTDDAKQDWWENNNGHKSFHSQLVSEFTNKTKRRLYAMNSNEFYQNIAQSYNIDIPNAVELALNITDDKYCQSVADDVFESIIDKISYSNTDYIDETTAFIGSEGIEELEDVGGTFDSAERIDIDEDNDLATYRFKFIVKAEGTSYEYSGMDEDTREVVTTPGIHHFFEGPIYVLVTRDIETFIDFEDDNSFEFAEIESGSLEETRHIDLGYEPEYGEYGNCPDCGVPLSTENDGGNGFCVNCAPNH